MLKLLAENSPEEVMMRLDGGPVAPIDPRSWNVEMTVSVNVGLVQGSEGRCTAGITGSATADHGSIWPDEWSNLGDQHAQHVCRHPELGWHPQC